jgi:hypothetical protein
MFAKLASLFVISLTCVSLAGGKDVVADPEDTDVPLFCSLNTVNSPKWEKDNKTIDASNKGYTLVPENGTLIVHKVDNAHMGVYVCKEEPAESETITLFVRPHVKPFEKSKNMIQEDPLQLECKGYGYPIPVVEWYTKGKLLVPDGVRITLKDTPAQSDSSVMVNGTIRITNMDFDDAGDYECVAENDHGRNNATISVKVKDKLAALWPFLGICAEVAILCTIIFIYEKRRTKRMQQEEERAATEEQERLNANNESKGNDDVRQRK